MHDERGEGNHWTIPYINHHVIHTFVMLMCKHPACIQHRSLALVNAFMNADFAIKGKRRSLMSNQRAFRILILCIPLYSHSSLFCCCAKTYIQVNVQVSLYIQNEDLMAKDKLTGRRWPLLTDISSSSAKWVQSDQYSNSMVIHISFVSFKRM